jgi:hypothetical protein
MYAKFAASFTRAKDSGDSPEFLVLANPGISLNPDQMKTPSYEISTLLDQVPRPSRSYLRSGLQYSKLYDHILNNAYVTRYQVAAYRALALEAKRILFNRMRPGQPTPEYAAYLRYRAEYDAAQDARTIAATENRTNGKPVPPQLDQAVETARQNWVTLGFKLKMQKAQEALQKIYDTNTLALFQNLRTDFQNAQLRGNQTQFWLPITANPPVEEWLSGKGWQPWIFHQSDVLEGAAPQAAPLPPGQAKVDPKAAGWSSTMILKVEVKRVNVSRPWMDPSIFSAHTWLLKETTGFRVVSSGNPADKDPGPMPIMVTGILLARNLSLTGYQASLNAEGSARIPDRMGPFDLGGFQAGKKALNRLITSSSAGTSITVAEPQIIAFFCQVVPKSPTPDPKFFR